MKACLPNSMEVRVPTAELTAHALGGARRQGNGWVARCPVPSHGRGRGDRKPSLSLHEEGGKVLVHCHAGCDQQNVIDTLRARGLWEKSEWGRRIAQVAQEECTLALDFWREAKSVEGTLVETYLRSRGITISVPPTLRFHPNLLHKPSGLRLSAMVAAVARVPVQRVVAIHRTYVTEDGHKAEVDPAKMSLGPIGGGAVRLAKAGNHLAVAEGIETALSVMQATGLPTWSALSAGGIRSLILPPPPLAAEITICADNDPVGLEAARDAADRWTREGRTVRIAVPPEDNDFNDLLVAQHRLKEAAA